MADISAFFLKLGITFGVQNVPGFKNSRQIFYFFFSEAGVVWNSFLVKSA